MALGTGTRLGAYEILSLLGSGGMGEVYRARDTKLGREVAIKLLPDELASDPDRSARFRREAELLAALNHPNIAAIYGLEESNGVSAIVMELVEGETLAEKLPYLGRTLSGPTMPADPNGRGLQIDEVIPIARQIVDALEAAHDRGIIHRDLKPANIKVTPDGKVKVLDFGLAKAMEGASEAEGPSRLSMSPTLSRHATYAGVILGTAAYMSPEQARGKLLDRRTDIWAFGCVLFEMLTGRQAFEGGETVSDAIAAILRSDIDWTALPEDTPPHLQSILHRCLQKDPQKRLPHIGVVRLELDDPPVPALPPARGIPQSTVRPKPLWKRVMFTAVTAIIVAALGITAGLSVKRQIPLPITQFAIPLAAGQVFSGPSRRVVTISPNGSHIAFVANNRLYLRSLADTEVRPIAGTEVNGGAIYSPVFSPDSRSIAYVNSLDRTLKRIALSGGASVTVCPIETIPWGLSWDASGIVFEMRNGVFRVSANGGKPEQLIAAKPGEVLRNPQLLPDTRTALFTVAQGSEGNVSNWETARIVAQSLTSGQRTTLVEGGIDARYLPTGHIVYWFRGVLFAVAFDARRLTVTSGPVPLIEGVRADVGSTAQYSFSDTGSLVFAPGAVSGAAAQQELALIDRHGTAQPLKMPAGQYQTPRVSPDGRQIAFGQDDGTEQMIWVYDLSETTSMRRLTFGGKNRYPVWSADSQAVAFQSDREGDAAIFMQRADGNGTAERLTKAEKGTVHVPESWSPDGKTLLFSIVTGTNEALWTLSFADKKVAAFDAVRSINPVNATFSPDGQWVAYQSRETETQATQIYVQPFPPTGAKYQISKTTTQSHHPVWSRDGKELFYIPGPTRLNVVSLTTKPTFVFSDPTPLQRGNLIEGGPTFIRPFDVARDGRIIAIELAGQTEPGPSRLQQIQVILNWFEDVKQKVPSG